ncbi:hypothetical protein K438DRAFT_1854787, partial [Mycena galopus ATCC 62051]
MAFPTAACFPASATSNALPSPHTVAGIHAHAGQPRAGLVRSGQQRGCRTGRRVLRPPRDALPARSAHLSRVPHQRRQPPSRPAPAHPFLFSPPSDPGHRNHDLGDTTAAAMARAWPRIEVLRLRSGDPDHEPRCTFLALVSFARGCDRIRELHLAFDASSVPQRVEGVSRPSL